MDVIFHEGYRAARPLGRGLYNYGGRHALGWGGRAAEAVVGGAILGTAFGVKLVGEHTLRSGVWLARSMPYAGANVRNGDPTNGNLRITQVPWFPIPGPHVRQKDRPDIFNELNMYESLEPHSHQWYTEAADALSRKIDQEFNRLLGEYQTPRTNLVQVLFNGLHPPRTIYLHGPTGAVLTDGGGGNAIPFVPGGPHPREAYIDPDLYDRLTSGDQAVSNKAHETLRARAQEFVQLEHLHQTELQEMRKAEKANKKMMHEVRKFLLLEKYIKGYNQALLTRSYEAENGFLRFIFGAL